MNAPRQPPIGNRRLFWAAVVLGWALIAIGVRGVLIHASFTRPPQWGAWFVGAVLFHDFLVAPLVFGIAIWLLRRLPRHARGPVQGALVVSALVAAATAPTVLRLGDPGFNPTVLPNPAGAGMLAILGGVWLFTGLILLRARRRTAHASGAQHSEKRRL